MRAFRPRLEGFILVVRISSLARGVIPDMDLMVVLPFLAYLVLPIEW